MAKQTYMRSPSGEVFSTQHPEYQKDCENLGSGEKGKAARKEYARSELRKLIKPGQTVHCVLRRVSSSGMSRDISLFVIHKGELRNIDSLAADATTRTLARGAGIAMQGCGMDMGFALVYDLGRALWPAGTKKPHGARNGAPDTDGGYALKSNWL
ncbi:hypothetical protein [Comamonas antarctica]|uniref:hypothetical protein n=1 Tax=Comamonas antarctica TaxID=2743470 RepID=UPI0028E89AB9|nr:hypothetical protein [Comamonas antarctica]